MSAEAYARRALESECAKLGSTMVGRNRQLNRSTFALGQLVGAGALDRREGENRLFAAARASASQSSA